MYFNALNPKNTFNRVSIMDTPYHLRIIASNGIKYFTEQISEKNIQNIVFRRDGTTTFFVEEGLLRVKSGESFNYFPVTDLLEATDKHYKITTRTKDSIEEKNETTNCLFTAYQIYDEVKQNFTGAQNEADNCLIALGNYALKLFYAVSHKNGDLIARNMENDKYPEGLLEIAKKSFCAAQEIEGLIEVKQIYQDQFPDKNAFEKLDSLIKEIEIASESKITS